MKMPNRSGFFQLQSPLDLLDKMEHDFQRLSQNPVDVCAAFDFFVAAAHLPEWLGKAKCSPGQAKKPSSKALRDICHQLANGAKHFQPDPDRSNSVDSGFVRPPCIPGQWVPDISILGDPTGVLVIVLGSEEASALNRMNISALELAGMVFSYWKAHPATERARKRFRPDGDADEGQPVDVA